MKEVDTLQALTDRQIGQEIENLENFLERHGDNYPSEQRLEELYTELGRRGHAAPRLGQMFRF